MVKLVHLNHVNGDVYVMRSVHLPVDPGFGVGGRPHPDHGLPGSPDHPDHELPAIPGVPDNTLPTTPPPTVPGGMVLVMVRTADGKWHWATVPAGSPPTTLPEPPQMGGGPKPPGTVTPPIAATPAPKG